VTKKETQMKKVRRAYEVQRLHSPLADKRSSDGGNPGRGREMAILAVLEELRHFAIFRKCSGIKIQVISEEGEAIDADTIDSAMSNI